MPSGDEMDLKNEILKLVKLALDEDVGSGDITAGLIAADTLATAQVITREEMVLCGRDFVNEVFNQVDPAVKLEWFYNDGDRVNASAVLFKMYGNARSLVTAERTALNFLQLLSATATTTYQYTRLLSGCHTRLLDTRKTIPGLRLAQKYAVICGGGYNHRLGLYDAFLIKENHIAGCGSIANAVETAHKIAPGKPVEVEVTTLVELQEAITAHANIVMLDNFTLPLMIDAVKLAAGAVKLEVSGGVSLSTISEIAKTGVDYVSVGAITKNIQAIDLSMRFI